jgi:hypothetical protein
VEVAPARRRGRWRHGFGTRERAGYLRTSARGARDQASLQAQPPPRPSYAGPPQKHGSRRRYAPHEPSDPTPPAGSPIEPFRAPGIRLSSPNAAVLDRRQAARATNSSWSPLDAVGALSWSKWARRAGSWSRRGALERRREEGEKMSGRMAPRANGCIDDIPSPEPWL